MKKIIYTFLALGFVTISCTKKETNPTITNTNITDTINEAPDQHTSQNSLDWNGNYQTTLPCADCTGIKTTITLLDNETFNYVAEYLEKNVTVKDSGEIMWHDNGSVVHLKGKEINMKLKVIENGLIGLDTEGKEIEGSLKEHYNYKKLD